MLSDRERSALNDIEHNLDTEDPELAERLASSTQSADKPLWRFWLAAGVVGFFLLISIGADMPIITLVLTMGLAGILTAGFVRYRREQPQ